MQATNAMKSLHQTGLSRVNNSCHVKVWLWSRILTLREESALFPTTSFSLLRIVTSGTAAHNGWMPLKCTAIFSWAHTKDDTFSLSSTYNKLSILTNCCSLLVLAFYWKKTRGDGLNPDYWLSNSNLWICSSVREIQIFSAYIWILTPVLHNFDPYWFLTIFCGFPF